MSKHSRSGGKYTGSHTSLIPLASTLCDIAARSPHVLKISPGFIKAGLPSARGKRRVKITEFSGNILLSVRDNISHQEIRIYTDNTEVVTDELSRYARKHSIGVTYGTPAS